MTRNRPENSCAERLRTRLAPPSQCADLAPTGRSAHCEAARSPYQASAARNYAVRHYCIGGRPPLRRAARYPGAHSWSWGNGFVCGQRRGRAVAFLPQVSPKEFINAYGARRILPSRDPGSAAAFPDGTFLHQRNVAVQQGSHVAEVVKIGRGVLVHLAVLVERADGSEFAMLFMVGEPLAVLTSFQVLKRPLRIVLPQPAGVDKGIPHNSAVK